MTRSTSVTTVVTLLLSLSGVVAPIASWAQVNPADLAQAKGLTSESTLPSGFYEGRLNVQGGIYLTLIFNVQAAGDRLTSTLSVPEQSAKDLPVAGTTFKDGTVTFELPNLGATFAGKLSPDKQSITGTFTQVGKNFPLTLTHKAAPTAYRRPQEPKAPFPYRTEDVSYPNPKAVGVTLAGTLIVPEGKGPFPTVLFITGSGPQDRDEALLGHRPFAVIADYLARRGIASLRVDDRGIGKSTGNFSAATSADFAEDVRAGVAFLKTRKEVNVKKIGLIGHSEGGMIAPMVAADTPDVAYIVLLAGTGVDGTQILLAQQELIAKAMGTKEADIAHTHAISEKLFTLIRNEQDETKLKTAMDTVVHEESASLPADKRKAAEDETTSSLKQLMTPWFRYFLTYDPAPTLKKVHCPVLAINGSKDLQVPPKQNLPTIQAALTAGGNKDVTIQELPGLNHLFQTSETGAPSEYASIEETFSPAALKVVGDWISSHTKP